MIALKTPAEIKILKEGGKILSAVLKEVSLSAEEGISLDYLNREAERLTLKLGGRPAFLNYLPAGGSRPYPASLCASVNDTVVHGIPDAYRLRNGDVLKLDFGVEYRGLFVDAAVTVGIGKISQEAQNLILTTKKALEIGIAECRVGKTLGDVGFTIDKFVRNCGFKTIRGLTGHGVGREIHEEPPVPNQGRRGEGATLKPGMVLALEPMVSSGSAQVIQKPDDSFATADGSLSAHFEHTVAVTDGDPIVLTA